MSASKPTGLVAGANNASLIGGGSTSLGAQTTFELPIISSKNVAHFAKAVGFDSGTKKQEIDDVANEVNNFIYSKSGDIEKTNVEGLLDELRRLLELAETRINDVNHWRSILLSASGNSDGATTGSAVLGGPAAQDTPRKGAKGAGKGTSFDKGRKQKGGDDDGDDDDMPKKRKRKHLKYEDMSETEEEDEEADESSAVGGKGKKGGAKQNKKRKDEPGKRKNAKREAPKAKQVAEQAEEEIAGVHVYDEKSLQFWDNIKTFFDYVTVDQARMLELKDPGKDPLFGMPRLGSKLPSGSGFLPDTKKADRMVFSPRIILERLTSALVMKANQDNSACCDSLADLAADTPSLPPMDVEVSENARMEISSLGITLKEPSENFEYEREDDEVCAELRNLKRQLRDQLTRNRKHKIQLLCHAVPVVAVDNARRKLDKSEAELRTFFSKWKRSSVEIRRGDKKVTEMQRILSERRLAKQELQAAERRMEALKRELEEVAGSGGPLPSVDDVLEGRTKPAQHAVSEKASNSNAAGKSKSRSRENKKAREKDTDADKENDTVKPSAKSKTSRAKATKSTASKDAKPKAKEKKDGSEYETVWGEKPKERAKASSRRKSGEGKTTHEVKSRAKGTKSNGKVLKVSTVSITPSIGDDDALLSAFRPQT